MSSFNNKRAHYKAKNKESKKEKEQPAIVIEQLKAEGTIDQKVTVSGLGICTLQPNQDQLTLWLSSTINEEELKWLQANTTNKYRCGGGRVHNDHVVAAVSRLESGYKVLAKLLKLNQGNLRVMEYWGNSSRIVQALMANLNVGKQALRDQMAEKYPNFRVIVSTSYLSANDYFHNEVTKDLPPYVITEAKERSLTDPINDIDVLLFIHSVYYLDVAQLVDLMQRTTRKEAWVVVHNYHRTLKLKGECCMNTTWFKSADGKTVTSIAGTSSPYKHSVPYWLNRSCHELTEGQYLVISKFAESKELYYTIYQLLITNAPVSSLDDIVEQDDCLPNSTIKIDRLEEVKSIFGVKPVTARSVAALVDCMGQKGVDIKDACAMTKLVINDKIVNNFIDDIYANNNALAHRNYKLEHFAVPMTLTKKLIDHATWAYMLMSEKVANVVIRSKVTLFIIALLLICTLLYVSYKSLILIIAYLFDDFIIIKSYVGVWFKELCHRCYNFVYYMWCQGHFKCLGLDCVCVSDYCYKSIVNWMSEYMIQPISSATLPFVNQSCEVYFPYMHLAEICDLIKIDGEYFANIKSATMALTNYGYISVIFVLPVIEEIAKYYFPYFRYHIAILEVVKLLYTEPASFWLLLYIIFHFIFHIRNNLNLNQAIINHIVWNIIAMHMFYPEQLLFHLVLLYLRSADRKSYYDNEDMDQYLWSTHTWNGPLYFKNYNFKPKPCLTILDFTSHIMKDIFKRVVFNPDKEAGILYGFGFSECPSLVAAITTDNLEAAFESRVGFQLSEEDSWRQAAYHFIHKYQSWMLKARKIYSENYEDWYSNQQPRVKEQINTMIDMGTNFVSTKKDFYHSAFGKVEKALKVVFDPLLMKLEVKRFTVRIVQGLKTIICLNVGQYFRSLTKAMYHSVPCDRDGYATIGYAGEMDNLAVGDWIHHQWDNRYRYWWTIDRTSWDGSLSSNALRSQLILYDQIKNIPQVHSFVYKTCKSIAATTMGLIFSYHGRMQTGNPNTTITNTNLALMSTVYTLDTHLNIRDYVILAAGDDMIIGFANLCDACLLNMEMYVEHQYEHFNLIAKSRLALHPVDIDFLSSYPLPCTVEGINAWAMTPKLGKSLMKICYTHRHLTPEEIPCWAKAVIIGMKHMVSHNPIFMEYLNAWDRKVQNVQPRMDLIDNMQIKTTTFDTLPSPFYHEWMIKRYGLDYNLIMYQGLDIYESSTSVTLFIPYIGLNRIVERDL